jgi:hypothetical protein
MPQLTSEMMGWFVTTTSHPYMGHSCPQQYNQGIGFFSFFFGSVGD